jgi:Cu(I)/Ag(I) efflux system membrane fusion protein
MEIRLKTEALPQIGESGERRRKMHRKEIFILAALIIFSSNLFFSSGWGPGTNGSWAQTPKESPAAVVPAKNGVGRTPGGTPSKEILLPKEEREVEISREKQKLIGVKKVEVALQQMGKIVRTVGRVEPDEGRLFTVNSKTETWVEKLFATYTGKFVKKGEPLAEVYSPELLANQLEYQNLLRWKTEKGHRLQRNVEFSWGDRYNTTGRMLTFDIDALLRVAQQRLKFWDFTDEQIKRLDEGADPLRTFTLYSPAAGYIIQKPAVQGRRFDPGEKLFDIADLSAVWVLADIYSYELPLIKPGQTARITLTHFPGKEFTSKIDFIYPQLSSETRTAKVRFVLPNPGDLLKPQMFGNVEIRIDLGKRLAIPDDAILDTGTRKVVFVEKGEGTFEPREVAVGYRGEGLTEIVKGLKAGDRVVSSGNFLIDSEAKLRGVIPQ